MGKKRSAFKGRIDLNYIYKQEGHLREWSVPTRGNESRKKPPKKNLSAEGRERGPGET